MDDCDRAEQLETAIKDATIKSIREKIVIPLNDSGVCWNCAAPVPDKRRWCDSDCRDEYESTNN